MASQAHSQYDAQREKLATYFDQTAQKAWIDLTSNAKVSGIRATVRAGRDEMRSTLMGWLPVDMRRTKMLDAGCGTGALSIDAACRGADITAIDVAGSLIDIAAKRADGFTGHGKIHWRSGDMLDPDLGTFDHIVAMDSLIHYSPDDMVETLARLTQRCRKSVLFTFAPHTPLLGAMHKVGKIFPRSDRSPAIVPVAERRLRERLSAFAEWRVARSHRVSSGFYKSQAFELVKR